QTNDHVVQPPFQLGKQVLTGNTLLSRRFLEVRTKLVFENSIDPFDLLFLTKLQAVTDDLRLPVSSVLPGSEVSLLDRTRRLEATLAFEKQLHSFAAAKTTNRSCVSSQINLSLLQTRSPASAVQTLRLFGGRHPLWGIGVASRIIRIS